LRETVVAQKKKTAGAIRKIRYREACQHGIPHIIEEPS
jgi:hypothetical protein